MQSAYRVESFDCDRTRGQERPGGRGDLPGGNSHRLSPLPQPGNPAVLAYVRSSSVPVPRMQAAFGTLTNMPLSGLYHEGRWMFYLGKFREGESVRKAARRCGINPKAFLWRHPVPGYAFLSQGAGRM